MVREKLDMNAYCRICMGSDSVVLISLFQIHDSEDEVIANMIIDCTEVMVSDEDMLPQSICSECMTRLNHAYKLRKQCQRSDRAFREMLVQATEEEMTFDKSACLYLTALKSNHYQTIRAEKYYDLVNISGVRCCGCIEVFETKGELTAHSMSVHKKRKRPDSKPHECPVCGWCFSNRKELVEHANDVRYQYYACRQCGLMLETKTDLLSHLKSVHNIEDRPALPAGNEPLNMNCCEEDEMENEHEIEYLDEAAELQEVIDITSKKMKLETTTINSFSKLNANQAPDPKFVLTEEDFVSYKIYHLRGEKCCGCLQLFDDVDSLMLHCDREHINCQDGNNDKFQCNVCFKRLDTNVLLDRHQQAAKHNTLYYCKLCDSFLADERIFMKHILTSDNHEVAVDTIKISDKFEEIAIDGIKCCGCDVVCENQTDMQVHIDQKHRPKQTLIEGEFECNGCFKRFTYSNLLERHKSEAQRQLLYFCRTEGCDYRTVNRKHIINHVTTLNAHRDIPRRQAKNQKKTQQQAAKFACCVARCYETFDTYEELERHAETLHELLRVQHTQDREADHTLCDICFKGFENEKAYTRHRTVDKIRKHVCLKCGAQYISKSNLLQHERSKCGKVATLQCNKCDKAFMTVGGLKNHQELHANKRSFVCDLCGRAFLRKGVLKDHINTVHSTVRLFQCSLCPKSFASRNIFQSHQMTHTKQKPYQCRHCEKRYLKTSDRTLHENQVHLGIRPFQCHFCPTAFIRDRERRLHERTHTKAKLYTCDKCTEGYNKFAEYKQHRLAEHGVETLRDLGPAVMAALRSESLTALEVDDSSQQEECKLEIEIFDDTSNELIVN